MHHYPFHCGDYIQSTAHLSEREDLAYRRLLDLYYSTEKPIPAETQWVSRRLRLDTETVASVLHEFFSECADGWRNVRCDAEIAKYRALQARNKANGSKGGRPKINDLQAEKPSGFPAGSQSQPTGKPTKNQEKNQEPVDSSLSEKKERKREKPKTQALTAPTWMPPELLADLRAHRKAVKAPLSQRALDGIAREAEKAHVAGHVATQAEAVTRMIERGWRGLEAEWLAPKPSGGRAGLSRREIEDAKIQEWINGGSGSTIEGEIIHERIG